MSQRILVATLILLGLTSLTSTGLVWSLMDRSQELHREMLAESREANAALLEQSQGANRELAEQARKSNEALLTKLGELASAAPREPMGLVQLEWNEFKVRLYSGEKPGTPVPNFQVTLTGHILDTGRSIGIEKKTDALGMVDFGMVRPGQHSLKIVSPWSEIREEKTITVLPGTKHLEEIPCPAAPREQANVEFRVDWPEELKTQQCWLLAHFVAQRKLRDEISWTLSLEKSNFAVLVSPTGAVGRLPTWVRNSRTGRVDQDLMFVLDPDRQEKSGVVLRGSRFQYEEQLVPQERGGDGTRTESIVAGQYPIFSFLLPEISTQGAVTFPEGRYRLRSVLLAAPPVELSVTTDERLKELMGLENKPDSSWQGVELRILAGFISKYHPSQFGYVQPSFSPRISFFPLSDWSEKPIAPDWMNQAQVDVRQREKLQLGFDVEPGKTNLWQVELPKVLVERALKNPILTDDSAPARDDAH